MLRIAVACCSLVTVAALGCSSSATTSPPAQRVSPTSSNFKAMVDGVANSGEIGSGQDELKKQFDELQKSDAAKAESIKPDFDAMLQADGNPAKVKQLAEQISKKL